MNILSYLTILSLLLFFLSFVIGYVICYFIVTPVLMRKHGKRTYRESYFWITNCLYAEDDLRKLFYENKDLTAQKTIKIIKICKYTLVIGFLLFIFFSFL
jgi:hypothetical protein